MIGNKEFNLVEFADTEYRRFIRFTYYSDNLKALETYEITFIVILKVQENPWVPSFNKDQMGQQLLQAG